MQKYSIKVKVAAICILFLALFTVGCFGTYHSMRAASERELAKLVAMDTDTPESCIQVIDGISSFLKRSYLLSDDMIFQAMDKLDECQNSSHSYIDVLSACVNSLLYAHASKSEAAVAENSIALGDCCLMLGAYSDAETVYSQILLRPYSDPDLAVRTYAAAELGLAKICVSTDRVFQAHEHVESCKVFAEAAGLEEYENYAEVILAEIQYCEKAYDGCAERVARLLPESDFQTMEATEKLVMPLLNLSSLTSAQKGDFSAAEQSTSRFITLADKYKFTNAISRHLDDLKTVYAQKGEPFPSAFEDELLDSYRTSAQKNIGFITEYALIEYIYFYKENSGFSTRFIFISLVVFFVLLFLLQLIVRLFLKAQTDPLTGLYNRSRFSKDCSAASRKKRSAFIMFDVDDFKLINDTFGHKAGDAVLTRVAREIHSHCGAGCRVYRIGGEEFAIIISNAKRCAPYALAESIRTGVEALKWREPGLTVTVSGGISDDPTSDLYRQADEKLYYSKSHGKNRIS